MNILLLVDIQNDFIPGGALAVQGGHEIISGVNELIGLGAGGRTGIGELGGATVAKDGLGDGIKIWDSIVLTQDFHPIGHSSFASSHKGKNPGELVELHYGTQVLWPDHCVQGTYGADFAPGLNIEAANLIVRKGFRGHIDSYSAFFENDKKTSTGLAGALQELTGSVDLKPRVFLAGLATDFCVGFSALDAVSLGFEAFVIWDLTRGIDLNGSMEAMRHELIEAGVNIIESGDIGKILGV